MLKDRLKTFIYDRQTWGFLISVAVMAILSLAFFYPDNFEGNTLQQHDMVQGLSNGHEVQTYAEQTGHTSRWTNSLFGGMPTFQISPSYPSDGLFKWVTSVLTLGMPAPSNILFLMMLGFMILMVSMKIRWEYGLIGAIAWGFSSYFIIIIGAGHIWKFVTLAYIPPTIAGVMLAYRGRWFGGGAMAAFFGMMQLSANHIQMSYYFVFVVIAIAAAYLYTAWREHSLRRWTIATGALIIAAAFAIGANSPNIYHTNKYAAETQRASGDSQQSVSGSSRIDFITQYSYGRNELLTLFIPNAKGGATLKPVDGEIKVMSLAETDAGNDLLANPEVGRYMDMFPQYFGEPEATNGPVYVGVIIFALFILGCIVVRGPLKWWLLGVTVLTILLSLGRNFMSLTQLFVDFVPMYSKFRTPESILVVAEFTMPLLAVMGLVAFVRRLPQERDCMFTALAWSFGCTAFVCVIGMVAPGVFGSGVTDAEVDAGVGAMPKLYKGIESVRYSLVAADSLRSLTFVILAVVVIYAATYFTRYTTAILSAGLCVLIGIDLYTVDKRYIDHESFTETKQMADSIKPDAIDTAILKDKDPNYRVAFYDSFGDAVHSYFHKTIGGYHAAKLGRYDDLITSGKIFNPAVLNMLNTRYEVSGGKVYNNPDALGNAWFVNYVNYVDDADAGLAALDVFDPTDTAIADKSFKPLLDKGVSDRQLSEREVIKLTEYAPDRLTYTYTADTDRVAVFSEIYFPWGWTLTVDGKPVDIARVNYVLRAAVVPAGRHEIVMEFAPKSIAVTTAMGFAGASLVWLWVILAVVGSFVTLRRKRAEK